MLMLKKQDLLEEPGTLDRRRQGNLPPDDQVLHPPSEGPRCLPSEPSTWPVATRHRRAMAMNENCTAFPMHCDTLVMTVALILSPLRHAKLN